MLFGANGTNHTGFLSDVMNALFGGRNGKMPERERPLRPGQIRRKKYVMFVLLNGTVSPPRRVKSRSVADLKDIPSEAIACYFENHLEMVLMDKREKVLLTSDKPSRVSKICFFKARDGSPLELYKAGLLTPQATDHLMLRGSPKIVVAAQQDCVCGECRTTIIAPDRYEILQKL